MKYWGSIEEARRIDRQGSERKERIVLKREKKVQRRMKCRNDKDKVKKWSIEEARRIDRQGLERKERIVLKYRKDKDKVKNEVSERKERIVLTREKKVQMRRNWKNEPEKVHTMNKNWISIEIREPGIGEEGRENNMRNED